MNFSRLTVYILQSISAMHIEHGGRGDFLKGGLSDMNGMLTLHVGHANVISNERGSKGRGRGRQRVTCTFVFTVGFIV